MKNLNRHIIFSSAARLVIAASILCVLFGNGVHIHAVFDHLFDHGDVHAFVHSHAEDQAQNHNHAPEFDDKDAHEHPTALVNLTGTLTKKVSTKAFVDSEFFSPSGDLSSYSFIQTTSLLYLDLPPPDPLYQSEHFSSYSLRGPPLG